MEFVKLSRVTNCSRALPGADFYGSYRGGIVDCYFAGSMTLIVKYVSILFLQVVLSAR